MRSKRRKLDNGSYEEDPQTFSYGYKGQVIPGQLRMEIASCDGGEYSDPHVPVVSYPQNVLLDDTSVYCTKTSRCNLLLKHVGGMPFTLTQIVVKAPRAGYDAPIQEGMIFVAMEDDKLLDNTSQYEIRWSPRSCRHHRHRAEGFRPSQEYLHLARAAHRPIDRSRFLTDPASEEQEHEDDEEEEAEDDLGGFLVPGFTVSVADPSDEDETRQSPPSPRPWHDDDYSLRSYVDRYRPVYLAGERNEGLWSSSSESEGYEPEATPPTDPRQQQQQQEQQELLDIENTLAHRNRLLDLMRAQQIRDSDEVFGRRGHQGEEDHDEQSQNRRSTPSRIGVRTFAPAVGTSNPSASSQEQSNTSARFGALASKHGAAEAGASSSARPDVISPHARFFISRSKSSTAIKFDPPV